MPAALMVGAYHIIFVAIENLPNPYPSSTWLWHILTQWNLMHLLTQDFHHL